MPAVQWIADGGAPIAPEAAAAEQAMANAAVSGGVRPADLERLIAGRETPGSPAYAAYAYAGRPGSMAQDVTTLAETHPAMQRLLGSAARQSTEAANDVASFLRARQTGFAPAEETAGLAARGLPTRVRGAPEMTGTEAQRTLGTSFGTPARSFVPGGQFARIGDALRRFLNIEDFGFHGHQLTGKTTADAIVDAARTNANRTYGWAYWAGRDADVPGALAPVFQRWENRIANQAEPVQKMLRNLMATFGKSRNLEQFDRNKRFLLDARIAKLQDKLSERTNAEAARVLTMFKNDMLDAVDAIPTNNAGALYGRARAEFSSPMETRDAYELGRAAWKEGSEIGLEHYNAIPGEGNQKAFRLGLYTGYLDKAETGLTGADRLRLFNTPRMENLLSEIIPRSNRGGATFANRPERFGAWRENEARMIETRNKAVGGSPTAERLADDQAYRALSTITEIYHSGGSPTAIAFNVARHALNRVFGMRQELSAQIARGLLDANPETRRQTVERVIARMGANRAKQLAQYLNRVQGFAVPSTAGAVAAQGRTDV
jgi:hypothetical protein